MKSALGSEGVLALRKDIDFAKRDMLGAREAQEDYSVFWASPSGADLIAVLADGMGGHAGGKVASKMAVDAFVATFNAYPAGSVPVKLGAALHEANNNLATGIKNAPALAGMGCTLVGIIIDAQGLQWISVGDSPLFLYRNKRVTRLNADHSMAPVIEESRRKGRITNEEASSHPHRNALRSALTGELLALIDTSSAPRPLCKGDVVILASDGLLSLSVNEIAAVVKRNPDATAESLAKMLIVSVEEKKRPRQDNTTVQVVILPTSIGTPLRSISTFWWLAVFLILGIALAGYGYQNQQQILDLWNSLNSLGAQTLHQEPVVSKPITPVPVNPDESPAGATAAAQSPAAEHKESGPLPNRKNEAPPPNKSATNSKNDRSKEKPKPEITKPPKATSVAPKANVPSTVSTTSEKDAKSPVKQEGITSKPSENAKASDSLKPEASKESTDKVEPPVLPVQPVPPAKPGDSKLPEVSVPAAPSVKLKADVAPLKSETLKPQADKGTVENTKDDKKSK